MQPEFIFSTIETQALVERIRAVRPELQIHTAIALAVWLTYIFSRNPLEWIGALKVAQDIAEKYLEREAKEEVKE